MPLSKIRVYVSVVICGIFAGFFLCSVQCYQERQRRDKEAIPIPRLQAEAIAKTTLSRHLEKIYGTNAINSAEEWGIREATFSRGQYVFHYRFRAKDGTERYGSLFVER